MNLKTTTKHLTIREQYEMLDSLSRSLMTVLQENTETKTDLEYARLNVIWQLGYTLGVDYNVQIAVGNSVKSPARYMYLPYIESVGWQKLDQYRMSVGSWSIPF